MVCLCKVLCVGDWKLFLLRLVIYLVLLFCFVFQVSLSQVSPSDFHVRMNHPHTESVEICLPLPALTAPSWLSGGVTAEVNRVPSEGRDEGDSRYRWCRPGNREQSCSAPVRCSELLSSAPRSAARSDGTAARSWFGRVVSVPACWKSEEFLYWSRLSWADGGP